MPSAMARPTTTPPPPPAARVLLLLFAYAWLPAIVNTLPVDQAILRDVLPPGSPKCGSNINNSNSNATTNTTTAGTAHITFAFSPSNVSQWTDSSKPWEELNFLAQIHHQDTNPNRTWTMRIGRGGNIYSLVGPYGEAIPSQMGPTSVWVDDVIMGVAVDLTKNTPDNPWFIHQAGTYTRDAEYTPPPFYSPNLAKHCPDATGGPTSCSFASWGQQAHVPTPFRSDVLFFYSYADCGNGVIEYTQGLQNNADPAAPGGGDTTNYHNVPWGGVRSTTFPHLLLSKTDGTLYQPEKVQYWGKDIHYLPKLSETGGYATFAQRELRAPNDTLHELPCFKGDSVIPTCGGGSKSDIFALNYTQFAMTVPQNDTCRPSPSHTEAKAGRSFVRCRTHGPEVPRIDAYLFWFETDRKLVFTNVRTGKSINVYDVVHWSFGNQQTYFSTDATVEELNAMFQSGDGIVVYESTAVDPGGENLGLTMVFGKNEEYNDKENDWYVRPSDFRFGMSGRDFYVATVRGGVKIEPGSTYFNRQYLISDGVEGMEEQARSWVDETRDDMMVYNDFDGRVIELYSDDNDGGETFGAAAADDAGGNRTSCIRGTVRCKGSSTPGSERKAFFAISCGNRSYFGPDQYAFSPERNDTIGGEPSEEQPIRSYACDGEEPSVRPHWTLLGYFPLTDGGCASLENSKYGPNFCHRDMPAAADATPSRTSTSTIDGISGSLSPTASPGNQALPESGGSSSSSQPTAPPSEATGKQTQSLTSAVTETSNSSTLAAFQMLALSLNLIFGAGMRLP